ncbi:hypothetical protein AWRI1631_46830, partial [Saccharomyces cerevisiae AWRI1631]
MMGIFGFASFNGLRETSINLGFPVVVFTLSGSLPVSWAVSECNVDFSSPSFLSDRLASSFKSVAIFSPGFFLSVFSTGDSINILFSFFGSPFVLSSVRVTSSEALVPTFSLISCTLWVSFAVSTLFSTGSTLSALFVSSSLSCDGSIVETAILTGGTFASLSSILIGVVTPFKVCPAIVELEWGSGVALSGDSELLISVPALLAGNCLSNCCFTR